MSWYIAVLKAYAEFGGRAGRAEYWYFVLFNILVSIGLSVALGLLGAMAGSDALGSLSGLYSLAVLVPSVAVGVRRLHDTGRSGWWMLIALVPILGAIALIYFLVLEGDAEGNEYGPGARSDPEHAVT